MHMSEVVSVSEVMTLSESVSDYVSDYVSEVLNLVSESEVKIFVSVSESASDTN